MKKMYYYMIGCCVLVGLASHAQYSILNQKAFGGSASDRLSYSQPTLDKGLIIGGSSVSGVGGEKSENSRGGMDFWVIKINQAGKTEWDKTYGGSGDDQLVSIKQTRDSGFILGGYSASDISGDKTANSKGNYDYWIIKISKTGSVIWQNTIGGNDIDMLGTLEQTIDGGFLLGGYSFSGISGDKSQPSKGGKDYWIVKLDQSGIKLWDKTFGGSGNEELTAVANTNNRGYIIGGTSASGKTGDKSDTSRGMEDFWILKLDRFGNKIWDKTFGGTQSDYCTGIVQVPGSEEYFVAGSSNSGSTGDKSQKKRGGMDYWIIKINATGIKEWDKTFGGDQDDFLSTIIINTANGIMAGGSSRSGASGEKTGHNRGSYDYWLVSLNWLGNFISDFTLGGIEDDRLIQINEMGRCAYTLAGYSYSGISGDKTEYPRGSYDYWLVGLKCTSKTNNIATESTTGLQKQPARPPEVFPNPVSDKLFIRSGNSETWSLYNQQGNLVLSQLIEGNGMLDVALLPPGIYRLKSNTTGRMKNIVIRH